MKEQILQVNWKETPVVNQRMIYGRILNKGRILNVKVNKPYSDKRESPLL